MPAHVGPRHGGSNQPRVSWRVCRELQPSGDQCRNLRPLPRCSEDMLWSGATAVMLSRCHAVILSGCDKTQYWTPGPRHLHTLQVTIDINLQLGITGGGGEGPHRKYIICFNTPLCVVAAGVRWLVQASIDRRLPRCQPSSCFLTPAGPDVFLPIPQQPGPCHTVIAYCHTVTLSHCHTVTLTATHLWPGWVTRWSYYPWYCCVLGNRGSRVLAGLIWAGREAY